MDTSRHETARSVAPPDIGIENTPLLYDLLTLDAGR
jgi:hypothetical protein